MLRKMLLKNKSAEGKNSASGNSNPQSKHIIYPSARAQRPIGKFYDEYSKGLNPFGFIACYGVADAATTPISEIKQLFDQFGVVKIRGVYDKEESRKLFKKCVQFSGLTPLDFRYVFGGERDFFAGGAPTLNDDFFWDYASKEMVQKIILSILGENSFEFGSSVAAHYSARGLHRDYRMLCEEGDNPYFYKSPERRIVRILHYCADSNMQGGQLGIVPFSHDLRLWNEQAPRIGLKRTPEWFDRHREVLTNARLTRNFVESDEIERHIVWVATDPGDIIVSNSAMLHCGEYMTNPRYFFVSTYASADDHTVPLAKKGVSSEISKRYYKFMAEKGFKGGLTLLES